MNINTESDYIPKNFAIQQLQSEHELRYLENVVLKNLRLKKSQLQMSRKLGYKFNLYGKWESGAKKLMWNDLVKVIKFNKIPLADILEDHYKISDPQKKSEAIIILRHFLDFYFHKDVKSLSEYLEASEPQIQRWGKGITKVPALVIFKLLIYRPQHFVHFLDNLPLTSLAPEIKDELQRMKALAQAQVTAPYSSAVLYFLETPAYQSLTKHDPQLIQQKLQLSARQVETALQILKNNDSVEFDGNKYILKERCFEFPASDYRKTIPMFHYWIYRSMCYLQEKLRNNAETEIPNASSFRVFSVSKKTAIKITEKIRQTHHEILQLIKEDDHTDLVVRAIVLNHFGLEESPAHQIIPDEEYGARLIKK